MRIGHFTGELTGPPRYVFGIWDSEAGNYVKEAEWIVVVTDDHRLMAARLQGMLSYFSSQQCTGVSSDVQRIMSRHNVPLSKEWKVYRTARTR